MSTHRPIRLLVPILSFGLLALSCSERSRTVSEPNGAGGMMALEMNPGSDESVEEGLGEGEATSSGGGGASGEGGMGSGGDSATTGGRSSGGAAAGGSASGGNASGGSFTGGDLSGPPDREVEYVKLAGAARQACALTAEGVLECWGAGGATRPPSGRYVDLTLATRGGPWDELEFGCAVREDDGKLDCWGEGLTPALLPPDVAFSKISAAGDNSVCGIRQSDARVECWGLITKTAAPEVEFSAIQNAGDVCGVREADELVACFNHYSNLIVDYSDLPLGRYQAESLIRVGGAAYCAVAIGQEELDCFAFSEDSSGTALSAENLMPEDDGYRALAGESSHACGVSVGSGVTRCWGDSTWSWSEETRDYLVETADFLSPPDGHFSQLASTLSGACGLEEGGMIQCWGGQRAQPDNGFSFDSVVTGNVTCGLRIDSGKVSCVSDFLGKGESRYVTGSTDSFVQLSLGLGFACGLQSSGEAVCWGPRYTAATPDTLFSEIASHSTTVCGIDADSSELTCWNVDGTAAEVPPSGKFVAVSASSVTSRPLEGSVSVYDGDTVEENGAVAKGNSRFCAIADDGSIRCWGCEEALDCEAPEGVFQAVSVSFDQACALTDEGEAICFPDDVPQPETDARFSDLAVGVGYACGIDKEEGTASCWGDGTTREVPSHRFSDLSVGHGYACGVTEADGRLICWGTFERNLWK